MATEIIMPQMGFDMKEGTVVRWIKREGDPVAKGEPIAEIETDKAVVEIEAFDAGVLRKVYVKEGATVPVGQIIGVIAKPGETVADAPPSAPALARAGPAAAPPAGEGPSEPKPRVSVADSERVPGAAKVLASPAPPALAAAPATPGERVKASPLARREAEARGIAIERVAGTGPGGRITRKDVIDFAQKAPARPAPAPSAAPAVQLGQTVPLSRIRQAVARSMSKSKQEIPHFYVTVTVDMTRAVDLRKQLNEALGEEARVSFNDMVIKAAALAILKHPLFNATFGEQGVQVHSQVNIGMAVALESGLVAPAIPNADRKSLAEIARETKSLAERARAGRLSAQEYGTATFTVTNLGMYGVESFSAIITPPQAAALAVGSIQKEAIVKDGQVAVADVMRVTLSCDHRVVDGAMGAAYLADVRSMLESPVRLLL